MILSFTLSMPNVASWNGQWSGPSNLYARVVNFGRGKKSNQKAQSILDSRYFHYNFGDGWSAGVSVKQVNSNEAKSIRKISHGFCGYDWMIDSIREHGEIKT